MRFSNMLEILQEKNKESIVLIKSGIFYIATGKDAIFLNKEFNLKCICFKKEICKIGIPESRLDYYLRKLEKINISYIVYHFDSNKELLTEKYNYKGKYHNKLNKNKNCSICKEDKDNEDKYSIAIKKLLESETKKNEK